MADPNNELTDDEEERVNTTVGVLILTGKEQLFPIDGQHRVAGIKKAVGENADLAGEEVTVILVGHAKTDTGRQRTRRLFVTLNQRAKKVSDRDIVALDEDNGLAVVTRRIIDEGALFSRPDLVSDSGSVAIPATDESAVTSILGLYQIIKGLYPRGKDHQPRFAVIKRSRSTDDQIEETHDYVTRYWTALIDNCPEYKRVIRMGTKKAGYYRSAERNHLLFRPAGQHAMAKATECLVSRGVGVEEAVETLVTANQLNLFDPTWYSILWDDVNRKMLNNVSVAETVLLTTAGQEARNPAALLRLENVRRERGRAGAET